MSTLGNPSSFTRLTREGCEHRNGQAIWEGFSTYVVSIVAVEGVSPLPSFCGTKGYRYGSSEGPLAILFGPFFSLDRGRQAAPAPMLVPRGS